MYFFLSFPSFLSVRFSLSLSLQLQSCLSVGMAVIQPNLSVPSCLACLSVFPLESRLKGAWQVWVHPACMSPFFLSVYLSVCLSVSLSGDNSNPSSLQHIIADLFMRRRLTPQWRQRKSKQHNSEWANYFLTWGETLLKKSQLGVEVLIICCSPRPHCPPVCVFVYQNPPPEKITQLCASVRNKAMGQ